MKARRGRMTEGPSGERADPLPVTSPDLQGAAGEARAPELEGALGQLVRGFGHDFNNLLNEIVGNLYLAARKTEPQPEVRQFLAEAERSAYLAKDLVGQLVALTSPGPVVRRALDLSKLLPGWVDLALKGSGRSGKVDVGPGLRPVEANEEQLRQVVHQLVSNAAEAMNESGIVSVSAVTAPSGPADTPAAGGPCQVVVVVADRGRGISRENLEHIFDPYFTTKEGAGHRGLGLAMCRAIIARHGGSIRVDSEVGRGARFTIALPCSGADARASDASAADAEPVRGRVLVMDDEELDRAVAGEILSHLSCEARFAGNGEEAVELYRKAHEAGEGFDLVIIDLVVPGSHGGEETLRRLREIDPGVRAVLSSGYFGAGLGPMPGAEGFAGTLPKPYRIEEMKRLLEHVCAKK